LRVLGEAVADGALVLNYARVESVIRESGTGRVVGARVRDRALDPGEVIDVHASVVVNATGAWADSLREQVGGVRRIRPLRGSHLIFPSWRLPVIQALSFLHPLDSRPVFIFPWEGATLVGTTDVDHDWGLDEEPVIAPDEVAYLMAAVASQFPSLGLTLDDIVSTYAGVRPVVGSGKADPSKESRDHVVWEESGLLTVTGGKLTTFRRIALDVLGVARKRLPEMGEPDRDMPVLSPVNLPLGHNSLSEAERKRLLGRYGRAAPLLVASAQHGELDRIPGVATLWAEIRWGARAEGVVHLDDLLLRRTRLGLLLPQGGAEIMGRIKQIVCDELGWDEERWRAELRTYLRLWEEHHSLPDRTAIPDWSLMLIAARETRTARAVLRRQRRRRRWLRGGIASGAVAGAGLLVGFGRWAWRRKK